jgi:death-on-curing protein
LLDAALSSPQNHFAYERVDVFDIAASYAFSITRNHPFSDGNKRVALTVAGVFLELNGYRLEASEQEAVAATVAISSRKLDRDGFANWLRGNSSRLSKEEPPRPRRSRKKK